MNHRKTDLGIPDRRRKSAKVVLVREVIAKRIVKAAQKGERNPQRLRDVGLEALRNIRPS